MPAALLAILTWFGRIAAVLGIGLEWTGRILDVVLKAIQQSKLFMTIAFMGMVVVFFSVATAIIELVLDLMGIDDLFQELLEYGAISEVVDLTPVISLGSWFLGFWMTSKLMLSTALGARIVFAFFGQFQKAIKI